MLNVELIAFCVLKFCAMFAGTFVNKCLGWRPFGGCSDALSIAGTVRSAPATPPRPLLACVAVYQQWCYHQPSCSTWSLLYNREQCNPNMGIALVIRVRLCCIRSNVYEVGVLIHLWKFLLFFNMSCLGSFVCKGSNCCCMQGMTIPFHAGAIGSWWFA